MKKLRRVYQTGSFREVKDVFVHDRYRARGARIKGNSGKNHLDANMREAIREATRILNGNFSYERQSMLCTFSFADRHLPANRDKAWDVFSKKFLRKLRKTCQLRGKELRMFAVVSDMDGETGDTVRCHIHAILDGCTAEDIRDGWALGTADIRTLRKEKTYGKLALYLLKQARCAPNEKKWHTSRNLERTKLISETEIAGTPKYRLPKGAELIAQGEYCPDEGKLLYMQIRMPEKTVRSLGCVRDDRAKTNRRV